ncbi:MAG TPA: glycosyl hydrolase, partial [Acidimicrobiales bacterium]
MSALTLKAAPGAGAAPNIAPSSGALLGAFVSGGPTAVTSFESRIGRKLAIDHRFWGWTDSWPTQSYEQWDVDNGRIPMVTWDGPNAKLDGILNGSQDANIRSHAAAVARFGRPILIRWGYEMNGKWAPWGGAQNGNDPSRYVAAWRRIVDLFRASGASNALWVWAPNVGDSPLVAWNHWTNYYPGDSYVDWVGVDGYNWGTTQSWSSWTSFASLFGGSSSVYRDYAARKPIIIAESGSVEAGGDKGAWWSAVPGALQTSFPAIKAVVFFNTIHNGIDWRAETSTASLDGYRRMARDAWLNPGTTTAAIAPASTAAPTITGIVDVGSTITTSTGSWSGTAPITYTYGWSRCDASGALCSPIAGATAQTYTVSLADAGATLRSTVTASNAAGQASAASPTVAVPVRMVAPASLTPPSVVGVPQSGQALRAEPGAWTGTPSFTYRWQRRGDLRGLIRAGSPLGYWRLGETAGTIAANQIAGGIPGTFVAASLGVPGA